MPPPSCTTTTPPPARSTASRREGEDLPGLASLVIIGRTTATANRETCATPPRRARGPSSPQERQRWKRGPLPQRPHAHRRWSQRLQLRRKSGAPARAAGGHLRRLLPAGHRVPHAGEPRAGPGHGIRRRGTELRVPRQQGRRRQADRRGRSRAFGRGAVEGDFGAAAIIRANSPGRRGTRPPTSIPS